MHCAKLTELPEIRQMLEYFDKSEDQLKPTVVFNCVFINNQD